MKKILLLIVFAVIAADAFAGYQASIYYRWRKDDGTEKTATYRNDGNSIISNLDPIRLRASFDNSNDSEAEPTAQLGYTLLCNGVAITEDSTTKAPFILYRSKYVNHGEPTTRQMDGYGTYLPGVVVTKNKGGAIALNYGQMSEVEWCIKPTRYVLPLTVYTFRPAMLHYRFKDMTLRTAENIVPPGNPADKVTLLAIEPVSEGLSVNFKTALARHRAIAIKVSRGPNNFYAIKTLINPAGTTFKEVIPPTVVNLHGDHYVCFELTDENGKITVTPAVKYNVKPYVRLKSFSVTPTNNPADPKQVEVKIVTSALYFPVIFLRVSDSKNIRDTSKYELHKQIIMGPGEYYAHNKLTTFTFLSYVLEYDQPRHFVVEYPQFDKRLTSQVITVKIPKPASLANAQQSFSIYPNPASSGRVSFDLKGYTGQTLTAKLTNLYGKLISNETFSVNPSENYVLKTNAAAGTYVLNVSGEGVTKSGKVLIQ